MVKAIKAGPPGAVVTGASSGIGREIVRCLLARGYEVVATGRNVFALEQLRSEHPDAAVRLHPTDLADSSSIDRLLDDLARSDFPIDVLVNCAGIGVIGEFAAADAERLMQIVRVNVDAVVLLTRHLAATMAERGGGHILNVASTAAFAPGPLMAVYYATKAFVLSFSLALREELMSRGVIVSTLCPGPTRTGFDLAAGAKGARLEGKGLMEARSVARVAVRDMLSGRRLIVPGLSNKFAVFAARFLPNAVVARYLYRFNSLK